MLGRSGLCSCGPEDAEMDGLFLKNAGKMISLHRLLLPHSIRSR